ncbi:hypothetical protein [Desulfosporosinus metallidurans]|uniref:Uncharacterized protein n=1 Tax=Desulfosporosinus metallidurans TaxID=1888891 RepID=A0A1Q8QFH3_9FIRM|nr:hypothetical protein [Desulfosporosinus metallidurans]OLN26103.1 hypothetical protein DSOL_5123 [Desulfosporosinus metallidurans]
MPEEQFIKISREILYNEIWEISAAGVAKKYNVPYVELLRLCKEIEIPIPPSGYWTKLNFGKPVEKIPLPKSSQSEVILPINVESKRSKCSANSESADAKNNEDNKSDIKDSEAGIAIEDAEEQSASEVTDENDNSQLTNRTVSGQWNTYNREKLYEEVWAKPVVQVAVQYGVSDVAIHKICKSLNVPVPPRGYWARLRAGEKMKKTPLHVAKGITEKTGLKSFAGVKESIALQQTLAFLTEEERQKVLLVAEKIQVYGENTKLHKKIISYHTKVKEWNKNDRKPEGAQRSFKNYTNRPPFLAGVISNETLPRVYRILDDIYRQIEMLGGSVNDDLSLTIRNESVSLEIFEAQDEVKHEITRQEAQELLIYEDAKRHNKWASQPNIRKYDYLFNGKLRICIRQSRYFRDSEKEKVESRLGDMLIELYEESEVVRKNREAYEEAKRKEAEAKRLREERKIRYNEEVDKTIALTNMAQDYDIASKIRVYINALESKVDMNDEKTAEWIDWAKKKADWFDPTVAREDELFGTREHEKSENEKTLKKAGSYWW